MGTSTWLAQYNAPCTDRGDTDITGHSIIQLSSNAVPDSFKSAWRSAAKQSPRQRSAAFITQTPQHGMNYNSSLSACSLLEHCWLEKGKKHASLVFSFSLSLACLFSLSLCLSFSISHCLSLFSFQLLSFIAFRAQKSPSSLIPNSICKHK